ncbi:hypothetical protein [Myxococcus xanthus]|uniref:hypothetical protein n=1 Tax=Myxococcus xanthus TaxID=34 RepID=UPI0020A49D3F|nr:hypothetical protein [Myxococcus xanthus]
MARLVAQAWAERGPHVECTVGDLTWRLLRNTQVRPREDITPWERTPGQPAGFAWAYGNGDVDLLVHPLVHADAFAEAVLPWVRARYERPPQPATMWELESNGPLLAALQRRGRRRTTGGCYLHLALEADTGCPLVSYTPPGCYRTQETWATRPLHGKATR